ncbi:MAG: hypothetical protein M3535_04985 [Actinomycetota bacterium]|nr:hypothetical protein [Actinomycetota bacterium]
MAAPHDHSLREREALAGHHRQSAIALAWGCTETFRGVVTDNLAKGRFRLVFAVDEITEELKRIVEFLNAHTSAELQVLAVAIGYVNDGGMEILTPAVYGIESAEKDRLGRKSSWDRASFLTELSRRSPDSTSGVEAVIEWAEARGAGEVYGSGKDGSWYPTWGGAKMRDSPISAWTSGSVCIDMYHFRRFPGFEEEPFRLELQQRLDQVGMALSSAKDTLSIEGRALSDGETLPRMRTVNREGGSGRTDTYPGHRGRWKRDDQPEARQQLGGPGTVHSGRHRRPKVDQGPRQSDVAPVGVLERALTRL